MDSERAEIQAIRPLQILVVNLMPKKQNTEVQLLRHLANTPLQLQVDFLYMASHHSKNISSDYLKTFYKTFADVEEKRYGGMIVTGAPVEPLPFKEVDYWDELCKIFEWSKTHVYSTLHLCWDAQAGIYYHYGIDKHPLPEKLSGIYEQSINQDSSNPATWRSWPKAPSSASRSRPRLTCGRSTVSDTWNTPATPWLKNTSGICEPAWAQSCRSTTFQMTIPARNPGWSGIWPPRPFSATGSTTRSTRKPRTTFSACAKGFPSMATCKGQKRTNYQTENKKRKKEGCNQCWLHPPFVLNSNYGILRN